MKEQVTENRREDPLVTVVVPVYNVAAYLRCCLISIQKQSYENLEILLIDDGSTDDSAMICQEYCDRDPRFRLIRQENQGLGAARNTGLDRATGSYICFVDADDVLHPDYVRILYENLITCQADLSVCRFEAFEGEAPEDLAKETGKRQNELKVVDQLGLLNALLKDDRDVRVTTMVAWNKLVSVDWLKGFHFENKWHEDQFMINEYVRRCRKAVFTTAVLYEYRRRQDSIMGKENNMDLRHLDDLEAHEQRIWYFYRPRYRAEWKDLFTADLKNQISWYMHFCNHKNTRILKKQIHSSYTWSFRQYLLTGSLFKISRINLHFIIFLLSPGLYSFLKDLFKILRN